MLLAHRIRLDPDSAQRDYFARAAGTARRVWNWALAEWQRQYDAGGKPNAMALKKQFNAMKYVDPDWLDDNGQPWLKTVHRDSHAQPFKHLERAWKTFFKQVRDKIPAHPPVFKRKNRCADSFYVANDKFRLEGRTVVLPKIGRVPLREPLRFDGKIMGGTVMREADNWFLSVQVEVDERQYQRQRSADGVVGVDLGITVAASLSTGEAFASPRPLKAGLRRLRIRARRNSRKFEAAKAAAGIFGKMPKGTRLPKSNNAVKGARSQARLYARIAAVRRDFTHKLTTDLCRKNHTVVIEDLHVKGMLSNRKLARSLSDIGFGAVRRQLQYKAARYGTTVLVADRWSRELARPAAPLRNGPALQGRLPCPHQLVFCAGWFPSSKLCSACGVKNTALTLRERSWTCPCGAKHERDHNAAINLQRLATATALPVASPAATPGTAPGLRPGGGGKVTPVRYEFGLHDGSGQEEDWAHKCALL